MPDLRDWEDRAKETSVLAREADIRYVIRCDQCSVDPLVLVTEAFKPRTGRVIRAHNEINRGHRARLEPKDKPDA